MRLPLGHERPALLEAEWLPPNSTGVAMTPYAGPIICKELLEHETRYRDAEIQSPAPSSYYGECWLDIPLNLQG